MSASKPNFAKKNTAMITAQETVIVTTTIATAIKTGLESLAKKLLVQTIAPTTAYASKENAIANQAFQVKVVPTKVV